jgi:hypothetical protein
MAVEAAEIAGTAETVQTDMCRIQGYRIPEMTLKQLVLPHQLDIQRPQLADHRDDMTTMFNQWKQIC